MPGRPPQGRAFTKARPVPTGPPQRRYFSGTVRDRHDLRTLRARRRGIDLAQVEALLEERRAARAAKDFDRSDALRQNLQELGVSVRDTPEGQVWDLE